jgi:hypothetical protein
MAYRELGVIEVREVLRRSRLGEGLRAIARGTGSARKTVANYVAAAQAAGLRRGGCRPDGRAGRGDPRRSPCAARGATVHVNNHFHRFMFQSTRPARGATGARRRSFFPSAVSSAGREPPTRTEVAR